LKVARLDLMHHEDALHVALLRDALQSLNKKQDYYTAIRYKKDGSEEKVLKCAYCDQALVHGSWISVKNGVPYRVWGLHCPSCNVSKEEGYEIL